MKRCAGVYKTPIQELTILAADHGEEVRAKRRGGIRRHRQRRAAQLARHRVSLLNRDVAEERGQAKQNKKTHTYPTPSTGFS